MSQRKGRSASPVNASDLDRSSALQRVFDELNGRLRALESGRGNGPGGSFGLPFTLVSGDDSWRFSVVGGVLVCRNMTTNVETVIV